MSIFAEVTSSAVIGFGYITVTASPTLLSSLSGAITILIYLPISPSQRVYDLVGVSILESAMAIAPLPSASSHLYQVISEVSLLATPKSRA